MIAVASVFPEAFCSRDLCTLSAVAAQASEVLGHTSGDDHRDAPAELPAIPGMSLAAKPPGTSGGRIWNRVGRHLASICDLAGQWQEKSKESVPDALVQDLGSIEENARQIRELLVC
jgi:hypothetical protein